MKEVQQWKDVFYWTDASKYIKTFRGFALQSKHLDKAADILGLVDIPPYKGDTTGSEIQVVKKIIEDTGFTPSWSDKNPKLDIRFADNTLIIEDVSSSWTVWLANVKGRWYLGRDTWLTKTNLILINRLNTYLNRKKGEQNDIRRSKISL